MASEQARPPTIKQELRSGRAAATRRDPMPLLTGLAAVAAILSFELMTPRGMSMISLYMLLAVYAAFRLSNVVAFPMLASVVLGGIVIRYLQIPGTGPIGWNVMAIEVWNGASRLVTICVLSIALRRLVEAVHCERARAERDPLTGVLNRRALVERLPALCAEARRGGGAVGLAYLDLDGFKSVNDRHGHATGDALLCRLSVCAGASLGNHDLFARVGGDEFVVALIGCDRAAAEARMAALHRRLVTALADMEPGVSCSMGAIVTDAARGLELEPLIARADSLMGEVKHGDKAAIRIAHYLPDEVRSDRPHLTVTLGRTPDLQLWPASALG